MYHLYTDMPLIEGVGDEVTVVFTIFLIFLLLCIAWFSTNIQELPFFSIIVIDFTRRQNRNAQQTNSVEASDSSAVSSTSSEESTGDTSIQEETDNASRSSSVDSVNEQVTGAESQIPVQTDDVSKTKDKKESSNENVITEESGEDRVLEDRNEDSDDLPTTETELRRRRVAFFSDKNQVIETKKENRNHESETIVINDRNPSNSSNNELPSNLQNNESNKTSESVKNETENLNSAEINVSSESETNSSQSDKVRIRLKYLNDTQRNVEASLEDTIEQFRRAHFAEELEADKLVRFIFNGQDLRNDANTLQAYNIVDNSVIHCLITQVNRQNTTSGVQNEDEGFDVGMLMLPCFGIILCFMWYLRFEYRQFFSGTSTVCLIGMSLLYIAALLAMMENRRRGHHHAHVD